MTDEPSIALPEILARIAEASGEEAALLVAREWGGRSLYIPRAFSKTHRLVELMGEDRARKMCAAIGHGSVLVPMGPFAGALERRVIAARKLEEGASQSEAARQAGVHLRTVERLAAKKRRDNQGDLF